VLARNVVYLGEYRIERLMVRLREDDPIHADASMAALLPASTYCSPIALPLYTVGPEFP